MKNNGKNQSGDDSCSVSEAASLLGVSIPTLKRMVADGQIEGFRTPGGHLRILSESIQELREGRKAQASPIREPSSVLRDRRERLEELVLESQELRARREVEKLRREEDDEAERRESEAQARERGAAEREATLELERERLEREQEEERRRRESKRRLSDFHHRWLEKAAEVLAARELNWLSAVQHKEVLDTLDIEIKSRQLQDEPRMRQVLIHTIAAVIEPWLVSREARKERERLLENAVRSLPFGATDRDKAHAAAAVREALSTLRSDAADFEVQAGIQAAIDPIRASVEWRRMTERLTSWAVGQLPWGSTDQDEARLHRKCEQILSELPENVSEIEAREALHQAVREARECVEDRKELNRRQEQKARLVQHGVTEVSYYLLKLNRAGEISNEEYRDSEFTASLKEAVKEELESELSGDEEINEVKELVREIIDDELS